MRWVGPYIKEQAVPINRAAQKTIASDAIDAAAAIGERFIAEIGLDRRCVVLTGTPNSDLDSTGIAEQLVARLNTASLFPPMDGLSTLDGGHLNLASAERRSGQFE